MNIIITANSPGELYGWVRPLSKRIKEYIPNSNITLILLPCVFSGGREFNIASNMETIYSVVTSGEYIRFILINKYPVAFSKYPPAVLIHLGGDIFHGALIARKLHIPAIAYMWANKYWDKYFIKYFVPQDSFKEKIIKQGIEDTKIEVTGNLVVDSVLDEMRKDVSGRITGNPAICIMPGSRENEIKHLLHFFLRTVELIKKELPEASFIFPLSPFIPIEFVKKVLLSPVPSGFSGSMGKVMERGNNKYIRTEDVEISLFFENSIPAMNMSDFILTIPGTKTLEAAILGKPMFVVTPLNRPDLIPYCGFIGLMDFIPVIGPAMKGRMIMKLASKFGFTALPNIFAGREIVPEMTDILTPENVSAGAVNLLKDKEHLNNITRELSSIYSPMEGACERVVNMIKEILQQ